MIKQKNEELIIASQGERLIIFEQIAKADPKIEPYRSGGFINKAYDMARVYVDLPIIEAKKLLKALKET